MGGELFVTGATRLAKRLGLPPLLISLTVVAVGTSLPELVVSLQSSLKGQGDLSIANVVGSNTFNICGILGLVAFASPIKVAPQVFRMDLPVMLFSVALLYGLLLMGPLGPAAGALFLLLCLGYLTMLWRTSREENNPQDANTVPSDRLTLVLPQLALGLGVLIFGGKITVDAAVEIAQNIGLSERIIGLTIVAVGTSLPELISSLIAIRKNENEIALGNVIGSNIFNIFFILGLSALISGARGLHFSSSVLGLDMPVLVAITLVASFFLWTGSRLGRKEGAALLALYVAYTTALIYSV